MLCRVATLHVSYFRTVVWAVAAAHQGTSHSMSPRRILENVSTISLRNVSWIILHISLAIMIHKQSNIPHCVADVFWVSFRNVKNNSSCPADSFLRMTSLPVSWVLMALLHYRASPIVNSPTVTSSIDLDYFLVVNLLFRLLCRPWKKELVFSYQNV